MDNKVSINLYKLKSLTDLIVFGYIRPMEKIIDFGTKIIPISIVGMCLRYIAAQMTTQLFAVIAIKSKKKKHSFSNTATYINKLVYIDVKNKKIVEMKGIRKMIKNIERMCFMENIKLSSDTITYFGKHTNDKNKDFFLGLNQNETYSAMISSQSNAVNIIFHENQTILKDKDSLKNVSESKLFSFPLKKINIDRSDNFETNMIYSDHYGLISNSKIGIDDDYGGYYSSSYSSKFCQLRFDDDKFEWKSMFKQNARNAITPNQLCLINSYSSIEDKLLSFHLHSHWSEKYIMMDLYSLNDATNQQIRSLQDGFGRQHFGTYYDISSQSLYIFGGDNGCSRTVNKYDFHKNEWIATDSMQFEHAWYPFAWMDGFVLFVAGGMKDRIGTIECYDTRYNQSHWFLANKDLQIDQILPPCSFKQIFGNNTYAF